MQLWFWVKRQTKCKAFLSLVLQGQLDGEMLDVRRFDDKISKSEKINDLNLSTSDCLASVRCLIVLGLLSVSHVSNRVPRIRLQRQHQAASLQGSQQECLVLHHGHDVVHSHVLLESTLQQLHTSLHPLQMQATMA